MNRSEDIAELAKALSAAQGEYPTVAKTKTGKVEGEGKKGHYEYSYRYADLSEAVEQVRPVNTKHGLSVSQLVEMMFANDQQQDILTTVLMHSSGQFLSASMMLRPTKSDPQAQGSAITYARRYAYCAILGVVADVDDDGRAASDRAQTARSTPQTTRRSPPPPAEDKPEETINEKRQGEVIAAFEAKGITDRTDRLDLTSLAAGRKVVSTKELTMRESNKVLAHLAKVPS